MIKNKVNPAAAEGTSSCEGAGGKKARGETREGGREESQRRRREATLRREDVFAHLLGRKR